MQISILILQNFYHSIDSHFDVRRAEKRLMENLDWRERNKIDTITQEDWRDFQDDYKWYAEGCDKEGKPGQLG